MSKQLTWWKKIWGHRTWRIVIIVVLVVVAIRAALPHAIKYYVNKTLDEIPEYDGRIEDVDLNILRGAYEIEGIDLVRVTKESRVPFFRAYKADLSIEWGALFKGKIVSEIELDSPELNFVSGEKEKQDQFWIDPVWIEKVKSLVPFDINSFRVYDGEIHFRNFTSDPPVNVYLDSITIDGRNFTNVEDLSGSMIAQVDLHGRAMKTGLVRMHLDIDPYMETPTFNFDGELSNLPLPRLNDFLKAYGKFDVEEGTFGLYMELAAAEGRITGYMKPLMNDLKVVNWEENVKQPAKLVWEAIVGFIGDIFTNPEKDRIATTIPISGRIKDPETDILTMLLGVIRNAFIRALIPGIENSVNLQDAKKD